MQRKGYSLLAVAVSAALAGPALASAPQKSQYSPEVEKLTTFDVSQKNKVKLGQSLNYFIVKLENAPLAKAATVSTQSATKGNRLDMSSAAAIKHSSVLAAERQSFAQSLKKFVPNAQIERHYDTVLNGVVVTSESDIFDQLSAMPGVSKVYREEMYYEQMDASLDLIKAKQVWEKLGGSAEAGKGIKVAVIDGGIRPENPMFRDDGFAAPEAKATDDYCATINPDFCNNKLIVARFSAPTFTTIPQEYMSPLGQGGHGTHVAGTVAGMPTSIYFNGSSNTDENGVEVTDATSAEGKKGFTKVDISGVAPGAYLMAYKALFQVFRADGTVTGSGSNVMLLEALDWAVKDGADVINNSWGGGAGGDPAASPYQESFLAAEAAGVVVVTAAGNDGPGAKTIGCPSCIESGISVASTTHGRYFANKVTAGGEDFLAIAGSEFPATVKDLEGNISAPVVLASAVDPTNALGCAAFPADTFKDKIAVISRGTCSFSIKVNNAAAAGAVAVIVIQNSDGEPSIMSTPGVTIPAVMISKADGAKLVAGAAVTIGISADKVMSAQFTDIMSDFSSRGPNGNSNFLKPDIGAPGSSILSATSPDAFEDSRTFQLNSGTSMASPHVAGAAAVMKQLYPEWSAVEIKTALTSTAVNGLKKEDSVTPTTPFDIGAGRLDLERATKAGVTFDKPSFAQDPCVGECTFTRTIRNMTDKEVTWTPSLSLTDEAMTGEFSMSSVTLKPYGTPGDSAEFSLKLNGSFATLDTWSFGHVVWTASDAAIPSATMPIAIRVATSADSSLLSTVAVGELSPTTPAQVSTTLNNKAFTGQVSVVSKLPAGTKLVESSGAATVTAGTQYLFDASTGSSAVSWSGSLNTPAMRFNADSAINYELATNGGVRIPCPGDCDEFYQPLNVGGIGLPVTFNGQTYSRVYISDNGIINFSNTVTTPAPSFTNQRLPSSATPNNLVAPFWADMDLSGGATGGGNLYYDILTLGSTDYLVVEWNKVKIYDDASGNEYTFQVWMALNSPEDIFFNYIDMDAMPSSVTVGAEDITGTFGVSQYYNGTGTAPVSAQSLSLANMPGGKLVMNYSVENTGELALGKVDTITVAEDTASEAVDVLVNDAASFEKVVQVKVTNGETTLDAFNTLTVTPDGALTNPVVVTAPANGTVAVTSGQFVYTPKANFNGTDSFTYQAEDQSGLKTVPTEVAVNVTAVNDAPTLVAGAAVTVEEGKSATLSVAGTDIDGDALTYTWTHVSGPSLAISATTASVTVTAPAVDSDQAVVLRVTASDGTATSAPVNVTLNVTNAKGSSGSFGWLSLMLLPLALLRRRRN
ncbi:MAG: S8 family serine peptidase [Pararheinheimera sp.]|nr:S8 family serine peptidase [Rheinheimera sp.]